MGESMNRARYSEVLGVCALQKVRKFTVLPNNEKKIWAGLRPAFSKVLSVPRYPISHSLRLSIVLLY